MSETESVPCPLGCGVSIQPDLTLRRTYKASPRQVVRQAMRIHLNHRHPGLTPRDVSLLLDRVCNELFLEAS